MLPRLAALARRLAISAPRTGNPAQVAHRNFCSAAPVPAPPIPMAHRRLTVEAFSGNQLTRGTTGCPGIQQILGQGLGSFLLVAERRVCIEPAGDGRPAAVCWFDLAGLQSLGCRHEAPSERFLLSTGGAEVAVPIYLLGRDGSGCIKLAADVSGVPREVLAGLQLSFSELRSLLPTLAQAELAVAGHAVALSQWHQAHAFCSRCGAPTAPSDAGARRQCTAVPGHRAYPRTDPVVIMLVESPDGQRALLGRSKKVPLPLYTCLAGFCDQGESVEEAVAREVREESGIVVACVDILGSQPWPIGRGGSCELMIGCIARARGEELVIDPEEMEDVRWVGLDDVRASVAAADNPSNPYLAGKGAVREGGAQPPYWIPPPFAIAHHLIKAWAEHGGAWFGQGLVSGQRSGTPSSL